MSKKLKQISFLFVFATLLVVIGHADITLDYKDLWIYKWVYSFHMPLFFFLSGFLFCHTHPDGRMRTVPFYRFMGKKVHRLLLPFLFINSVIFLIKSRFVSTELMQHPVSFSFGSWMESLFLHPIGFMWFLPCLFMVFLLFVPFMRWVLVDDYLQMGGVISLFLLSHYLPHLDFMQVSSAIYYSGYFGLGILYCSNKVRVEEWIMKYRYIVLLVSFTLSVYIIPMKEVAALAGISFSLALSLIVERYCGERIVRLSDYTYTVFLLSYFPQMLVRGPITHHFPEINQYVFSCLSVVVGCSIPVFIGICYQQLQRKFVLLKPLGFLIGI